MTIVSVSVMEPEKVVLLLLVMLCVPLMLVRLKVMLLLIMMMTVMIAAYSLIYARDDRVMGPEYEDLQQTDRRTTIDSK